MLLSLAALALAQVDMGPLLDRGPLVLVEEDGGRFEQATALVLIDAPPDHVWAVMQRLEDFKDFIPKVLVSEVTRRGPKDFDVHFVIDVPGPDTDYTVRYTPDAATRTLNGTWLKGDLKASRWQWRVEAAPDGKSLLHHMMKMKNFSALAQGLDDDSQTLTVGINVTSGLAAAKAVKKRCEETRPK